MNDITIVIEIKDGHQKISSNRPSNDMELIGILRFLEKAIFVRAMQKDLKSNTKKQPRKKKTHDKTGTTDEALVRNIYYCIKYRP